jgi:hypothetical protein
VEQFTNMLQYVAQQPSNELAVMIWLFPRGQERTLYQLSLPQQATLWGAAHPALRSNKQMLGGHFLGP